MTPASQYYIPIVLPDDEPPQCNCHNHSKSCTCSLKCLVSHNLYLNEINNNYKLIVFYLKEMST